MATQQHCNDGALSCMAQLPVESTYIVHKATDLPPAKTITHMPHCSLHYSIPNGIRSRWNLSHYPILQDGIIPSRVTKASLCTILNPVLIKQVESVYYRIEPISLSKFSGT